MSHGLCVHTTLSFNIFSNISVRFCSSFSHFSFVQFFLSLILLLLLLFRFVSFVKRTDAITFQAILAYELSLQAWLERWKHASHLSILIERNMILLFTTRKFTIGCCFHYLFIYSFFSPLLIYHIVMYIVGVCVIIISLSIYSSRNINIFHANQILYCIVDIIF